MRATASRVPVTRAQFRRLMQMYGICTTRPAADAQFFKLLGEDVILSSSDGTAYVVDLDRLDSKVESEESSQLPEMLEGGSRSLSHTHPAVTDIPVIPAEGGSRSLSHTHRGAGE